MSSLRSFLLEALRGRLNASQEAFRADAVSEIARGVDGARLSALLSRASRFAPRRAYSPDEEELQRAESLLASWSPKYWSMLDLLRAHLILEHPQLAEPDGEQAIEECFRFADEGESCALFRTIPLCPEPERFLWRVSDGCRTNMTSVFEAIACDSPYPVQYFDDVAWHQLIVKAIFIGVPVARIQGLDSRLDEELARIALDLADERRSAGREVQSDLWMALGSFGGERALASIEQELNEGNPTGRAAAALALARAGHAERLESRLADESDARVAETMRRALAGDSGQRAFESLSLQETHA